MKKSLSYRVPGLISLSLHLLLLGILMSHMSAKAYRQRAPLGTTPVISAVAVDQAQVKAQVAKLHALQRQAEQRRIQQQEAQAARRAKQIQQAKQKRLAKLRLEQRAKARVLAAARRRRLARAKALALKKQQKKLAREKVQKRHQQQLARINQLQQSLLDQQLAQEQKQLAAQRAQQLQGVVDEYVAKIRQAVEQNWLPPIGMNQVTCVVYVLLAPKGVVISAKVIDSSGNKAFDNSAVTAVFKTSPLPVPSDPKLFNRFRELRLTMSPKDVT